MGSSCYKSFNRAKRLGSGQGNSLGITDEIKLAERAAAMLDRGAKLEEFEQRRGPGRPTVMVRITDINGAVLEIPKRLLAMGKKSGEVPATIAKAMTEVEYAEMCRLAVPSLMDRAIRLAQASDDVKEVMSVLKELNDRGFGRVAKVQGETEEADYLRRSWKEFPEHTGFPMIVDVEDEKPE